MTDFSLKATGGRVEDILLLFLLGALIYFAVAYSRRRGGRGPNFLGWSAVIALLIYAVMVGAEVVREALRASNPPREDPDLPIMHETWNLLGGVTSLLFGVALLACGVALVYVGWSESKTGRRGAKQKPKRA